VLALGKHPGWAEFIDDCGRMNASLAACKRAVFDLGIVPAAQRGLWEGVPVSDRLPGFAHDLLWVPAPSAGQAPVLGRMWTGTDGRGRGGWPMLVLACVERARASWLVESVLPRLAAVEAVCGQTKSAQLVKLSMGEATHQIEDTLAMLVGPPRPSESDAQLLARFAQADGWLGGGGGDLRATRLARVREAVAGGALHVRVPRLLTGAGRGLRAWAGVLAPLVAERALLLADRTDGDFVDVFVGGPDPLVLGCLRTARIGLATDDGPAPSVQAERDAEEGLRAMSEAGAREGRGPARVDEGRLSKRAVVLLGLGAAAIAGVWALRRPAQETQRATLPRPMVAPGAATIELGEKTSEKTAREGGVKSERADRIPDGAPYGVRDVVRDVVRDRAASLRASVREGWAALEQEARDQGMEIDADRGADMSTRVRAMRDDEESGPEGVATLEALQRDIDAARSVAAGRVLAFAREASRALPPALASREDVLREAYVAGVQRVEPRRGMRAARERVSALEEGLVALDDRVRGMAERVRVPGTQTLQGADVLAGALRDRRERALRAGAGAIARDDAEGAGRAVEGFDAWTRDAERVVERAVELTRALDAGERESVAREALGGEWARAARGASDLQASVGDVLERLARVREVLHAPDAGAVQDLLVRAADDSGRRVSEVRVAWWRLREMGWPKNGTEAARAQELLATRVLPAIRVQADEASRGAAQREVRDVAREMWRGYVVGVGSAEELREARDRAPGFSVDLASDEPEDRALRDQLPAWVRLGMARMPLDEAIKSGSDVTDAARAFVQQADAWRELEADRPGLRRLREVASKVASGVSAGASLDELGPGSKGWKLALAEDESLVYVSAEPKGREAVRVRFVPLARRESDMETVVYLSTTEISVAMARRVVAGEPGLVSRLPAHRLGAADARLGPRTWGWEGDPAKGIMGLPAMNASGGWLRGGAHDEREGIGQGVEPVSWNSPMNYISPQGAAAVAEAMGCRLPTAEEWRGAVAGTVKTGTVKTGTEKTGTESNLRDGAWAEQAKAGRAQAADMFIPANSQRLDVGQDTEPSTQGNDGVVWLSPVSRGGQAGSFHHLVGNVAEWVTAGLEGSGYQVVGGSALSARYETLEPQAVDVAKAADGYSDVGFRVAFVARVQAAARGSVGQELREAAAAQGFVGPETERRE
jgi:hypothetical protein